MEDFKFSSEVQSEESIELTRKAIQAEFEENGTYGWRYPQGVILEELLEEKKSREKTNKAVSIVLDIDEEGLPFDKDFTRRIGVVGNGYSFFSGHGFFPCSVSYSRIIQQTSTGKNFLQHIYNEYYAKEDGKVYTRFSHYGNEFFEVEYVTTEKVVWMIKEE